MAIYLRKFKATREYEWAKDNLIKPNVSLCKDTEIVHYGPLKCEESDTYELNGSPYYPSTVDGNDSSFNMTIYYKKTHISTKCAESESYGSEAVVVEIGVNPSTTSSRTVEGTYDYHGLEVPYSVTQTARKAIAVGKFNVTSTTESTTISSSSPNFYKMKIDGVELSYPTNSYTFDSIGVHTVEYVLGDSSIIHDSAFGSCTSLTSITIPDSVTSIGSWAFYECSGLTSINIPNSVTSIGNYAFYRCSSFTSIDIPSGVTSIGNYAFQECSGITSCTIGSGVTSIGDSAFSECYSLTSIVIPDNVTSIGDEAFSYCSDLTSCTIGSGVTSIGSGAFYRCTSLTSITIPDSVTSIGSGAFQFCSDLTRCTIGNSVTSIAGSTFTDCRSLTSVNIPSSVTSIGERAFWQCHGITSITIPDRVTSIGDRAFQNCIGLTSITIPDRVTSIGDRAFQNCIGLTSCTIGNSVTSIGSGAFSSCGSLTNITSNAITAPTILSDTFYNVKTGGTLTVPSGSSGYDVWTGTGDYYLGKYSWTKTEQ
jgi:hypothetical protein